jgi:hypothetical protein
MRIRKGYWCFCVWRRNGRRNKLFCLQYISMLSSLPKEKHYQVIVFQTKNCFKTNNSFLLYSAFRRVSFVQKHYLYTVKQSFICYKFCNISLHEGTNCFVSTLLYILTSLEKFGTSWMWSSGFRGYRRFGGACCLLLHDKSALETHNSILHW